MDEWTAFLSARLDEDEAAAKAWLPLVRLDGSGSWYDEVGESNLGPYSIEHARLHDPARVLREVAAKRAILDRHMPHEPAFGGPACNWCSEDVDDRPQLAKERWPCPDVFSLAAVWSDHPGYPGRRQDGAEVTATCSS